MLPFLCQYLKKTFYQRPKWGFDLGHFRGDGGGGQKLKKIFEKKVKALLQVNINCIKVVWKSHISHYTIEVNE